MSPSPVARRLWITGGGTREPLDAVRFVGNRSTGRLALCLIDEALRRGLSVRALLASDVPAPADHPSLVVERFETAQDLQGLLTRTGEEPPRALIHSAAVADYAPEPEDGKVPSGRGTWVVTFRALPKVVDAFRRLFTFRHVLRVRTALVEISSPIETPPASRFPQGSPPKWQIQSDNRV